MDNPKLGAENIRWDLSAMYKGLHDPQIDADLKDLVARSKAFNENYKGKVKEKLGAAIGDYAELDMLGNKIFVYLFLFQSQDVTNAPVKAKLASAQTMVSVAQAENLTFFDIELVGIDDATLAALYKSDPVVARHKPWIEHARIYKPHLLSEPVEAALTKRSPFGPGAWSEFFDETEADLRFTHNGETKTLTEMLGILTNSKDHEERKTALRSINEGLAGPFAKYSAQTLYVIAGESAVERNDRGYKNPMDARNKSNRIPDDVVQMLHKSVTEIGGPLARRYYKLKAKMLGVKTLTWSDRNAPLPLADTTIVPFDDAWALVLQAYESFSPTLAALVRDFKKLGRVDAPATQGKHTGAYNYSIVLPGNKPASFTLLNYLGSDHDVMTLAHELGHGVHGILAGEAQGPLMFSAPTAYCETASVFGEMTTFNFLKKRLVEKGDKDGLIALIAQKIEDSLNTVVRQIGFSNFERRLHGMDAAYEKWNEPQKFSPAELDAIWLQTLKEFYGAEGDVFIYENTEHLWAYVSHFHRPFYVYGYAFGELLTRSLYAAQPSFGDTFEPLYLDMLRSGSTKNVVELLAPFKLDPTKEAFWANGIKVSLENMIEELEGLIAKKK